MGVLRSLLDTNPYNNLNVLFHKITQNTKYNIYLSLSSNNVMTFMKHLYSKSLGSLIFINWVD